MRNAAKSKSPPPRRRARGGGSIWLKAFVWVLLAIFVLTSVGVVLVITAVH